MASKHTLILVPLRDREADWEALKNALWTRAPAGRGRTTLWAAEQLPGLPFNRGALLNAGFADALQNHPEIDEVLIHDVDTLPNTFTAYGETRPVCGVVAHHFGQPDSLGGVWSTDPDTYRRMGGHPRSFWGWGYEDSVMEARASAVDVPVHKHADGGRSHFTSGTHLRDRAGSQGRYQEAKGIMGLDRALLRQELLRDGVQTQRTTRVEIRREENIREIDVVRVLYGLHAPPAAVQPVMLLPPSLQGPEDGGASLLTQLRFGARLYGWSVPSQTLLPGAVRDPALPIRAGVPLVVLGCPPPRPDALLLRYDAKGHALVGKTPLGATSPPLRDFAALATWVSKSTTVLTGRPLPLHPAFGSMTSLSSPDDGQTTATQTVWPDDWRIPLLGPQDKLQSVTRFPSSSMGRAPSSGTLTHPGQARAERFALAVGIVLVLVVLVVAVWAVARLQ